MTSVNGLRAAARRRIGAAIHRAGGVTRVDIRQLRDELGAALAQQHQTAARAAELDAENRQLRAELSAALETQLEHSARLGDLEAMANGLEETATTLEEGGAEYAAELATVAGIETLSRWLRHATLTTSPPVSVIIPTRNRPELLGRAIQSVQAQRYENWELIIVHDPGDESAGPVVEAANSSRISLLTTRGKGGGAARNTALEAAKGEIVAYLDDDNMMDSEWLYAVVWAFEQRRDMEVLYGAQVVDDMDRLSGDGPGALPTVHLDPFDRDALCTRNLSDISAIAHRTGLPEARFDEDLRQFVDWDFLLRLTARRDPMVLPAVAVYYTTDAPNRLLGQPADSRELDKIRRRAARGEY